MKTKMNIVMAADTYYKNQLEVAIKSIMTCNRSVHFFLLNNDFSQEWFKEMNCRLEYFDSYITDCKIENKHFNNFKTNSYITEATFYRYHIPNIIKEEKVLYLDVDLIVTGDLHSLYDDDVQDVYLAGVEDIGIAYFQKKKEFNAGVMLINNKKWREKGVLEKALGIHKNPDIMLPDADQTVLNILFEKNWLEVSDTYNQQVFAGFPFVRRNNPVKKSVIIHYTTSVKPFTKFYKKIKQLTSLLVKHRKITIVEFIRNIYRIPLSDEWNKVSEMSWSEVSRMNHEQSEL